MKKKTEQKTSKKKTPKVTAKEIEKESSKNVVSVPQETPQETKTEEIEKSDKKNNNEQENGTLDKVRNESSHQYNLDGTVDEYDKDRKLMQDQHAAQIQNLNKKCNRDLNKKAKEFDKKIHDLDRKLTLELIPSGEPIDHDKIQSEIEDLRKQKQSALEEIKASYESQLKSLKEKQKLEEEQLEQKTQDSIARQKQKEEEKNNKKKEAKKKEKERIQARIDKGVKEELQKISDKSKDVKKLKEEFIECCARIEQCLSAFWNVVLNLKYIKDKKLWKYSDEPYDGFEDFMFRRFGFHRSYYSQLNTAYTIWSVLKDKGEVNPQNLRDSAGVFYELSKIRKDGKIDFDEIIVLFKELNENGTPTIADVKKRVKALLPVKSEDDKFIGSANMIFTLARKLNTEKLDRQKLNIDKMTDDEKIELKKILLQMCDLLS